MYSWSRRIFAVNLFFVLAGISGLLFYSLMSIFYSNYEGAALWINILIFFTAGFAVLIYFSDHISQALKILLTFILFPGSFFTVRYIFSNFLGYLRIPVFTPGQMLLMVLGLYLVQRLYLSVIKKGFDRIFSILECEGGFDSHDKFREWAEGQVNVRSGETGPSWYVKIITNTVFALLVLSFISIAKNPGTRWYDSIFLLCLGAGGTGIYLVLFQLSSILRWKLLGYKVGEDMLSNWNRIISFSPIFLIVMSIAIPWNFSVFPSGALTKFIRGLFTFLGGNLAEQSYSPPDNSLPLKQAVNPASQQDAGLLKWAAYLIIAIGAYIALYLAAAAAGFILYIIFRNRKSPAWAGFFIKRFLRVSKIVRGVGDALFFLLKFFLAMFGLAEIKGQDKRKMSAIEKQLLSFFDNYVKLSEEKLDEIKMIIRDFLRLIEAASASVVPYYIHYGPGEYMDMLRERLPDQGGDISQISSIFNESRYSLHLLPESRKKGFRPAVDRVISGIKDFERRKPVPKGKPL